jgi:hypothetical protein
LKIRSNSIFSNTYNAKLCSYYSNIHFCKMMNFSPIYLCPPLLLLNFKKIELRLRFDKITKGVQLIPNVHYIVICYQVPNSSCTLRITGSKIGDFKSVWMYQKRARVRYLNFRSFLPCGQLAYIASVHVDRC